MTSLFHELPTDNPALLKIEEQQRARYSKYSLTRNPFPLGGNFPEGYLEFTQLEPSQRRQVDDFLASTFVRKEFNGLLILGEYGSGKSHLLNFIAETINADKLGVFEGRALAFVIQNPSVAPEDILISLMRTVKLGAIQDLVFLPVRRQLRTEFGDNLLPFLQQFTSFTTQMKITGAALEHQEYRPTWYSNLFSIGYREFRQVLRQQNVSLKVKEMRYYAHRTLTATVSDNPVIVDGLVGLIFDDEAKDASSWETFLFRSLSRGQAIGVEYYLGAILRLFEIMGMRHVYLLVDEIEDLRTQRLSKKAATEYLAALRRMIQHNFRLFSFVLASTRDAWDELRLYYPAIEDRFPVTIDLVRQAPQIKQIIAAYLSRARVGGYQGSPWYPFDELAVDRLIALRGTILRHVITECRKLIDLGVEEGLAPPLLAKFVEDNVQVSGYSQS